MTIAISVDLRAAHGPVRDQGPRPTCLAFALSDINGERHRQPASLSPEYLYRQAVCATPSWRPGKGLPLSVGLGCVASPGQPFESQMPYEADEPAIPVPPNPQFAPMFARGLQQQAFCMADVCAALRQSRSVGLVIRLTRAFFSATPTADRVPFSSEVEPGCHAVIAVGLGIDVGTDEACVLVRNSWGIDWGDAGHAWLSEQYLIAHAERTFGD